MRDEILSYKVLHKAPLIIVELVTYYHPLYFIEGGKLESFRLLCF
jgi:hypothetical protein